VPIHSGNIEAGCISAMPHAGQEAHASCP
jgi:hypothetical protein